MIDTVLDDAKKYWEKNDKAREYIESGAHLGDLLLLRRGALDVLDAPNDDLDAPGNGRQDQQDQAGDGDDALNILDDVHGVSPLNLTQVLTRAEAGVLDSLVCDGGWHRCRGQAGECVAGCAGRHGGAQGHRHRQVL